MKIAARRYKHGLVCTEQNKRIFQLLLQVLEQMKRELRKKMEKEIIDFQKRMWEDEDDVYYRELDAERVLHELNVSRFQAKV